MLCNSGRVYLEIYKVSTHYKFYQIQVWRVFFFHKSSTGATASIISTHHLSVWQFLNQYCIFFLDFICCLESSCFLIPFSLNTKILIIFLSVFCLCILNMYSLVHNCREVVKKTIIYCCKHAVVYCMHPPSLAFSRVDNGLAQRWPVLTFSM